MVAIRNIQCRAQELDWTEHLVRKHRVQADQGAFVLGQLTGLEQDRIGDAHLADIVQQRPAANVDKRIAIHAHRARQPLGQDSDALGVSLRFLIFQIQGAHPAFQGGLVGLFQLPVAFLQPVEQVRIVDRHGCLVCKR